MLLPTNRWFVRELDDGETQLWHFRGDQASRAGVSSPERGPGTFYEAKPGESIWETIRLSTPWLTGREGTGPFTPVNHPAGEYHPRMARPVLGYGIECSFLPDSEDHSRYIRGAQIQLEALVSEIELIARVVEPTSHTLSVHGHAIRNLLILAATKVEMHMRGVLSANGFDTTRCSTKDFVRLNSPLRLKDYSIRFQRFPALPPITPFAAWDSQRPTQSLAWYDAYNGVKHNRDGEFERATLENALNAVAGCAAILVAQFGERAFPDELKRFLAVETAAWPYGEMYVAPQDPSGWAPVAYFDLR